MRRLAAIGVVLALGMTVIACGEEGEAGGGGAPAVTQDAQEQREALREARR